MVKFNQGDIVQLKSGGPKMTVKTDSDSYDTDVYCQWFAGNKLNAGSFSPETLIKIKDDDNEDEKSKK